MSYRSIISDYLDGIGPLVFNGLVIHTIFSFLVEIKEPSPRYRYIYVNGLLIDEKRYYRNGMLMSHYVYNTNHLKQSKHWYGNGNIAMIETYIDGVLLFRKKWYFSEVVDSLRSCTLTKN